MTPESQPVISVRVATFPREEFAAGISLQHELVFDGCRYESQIRVPELYSYLVRGAAGEYKWRPPGGTEIMIRNSDDRTDHPWKVNASAPDQFLVISSDGRSSFAYEACLLVTLTISGREYRFDYEQRRLCGVRRSRPDPQQLVSITYDDRGDVHALRAGGKNISFGFNNEGQLTSCLDVESGLPLLEAGYTNGLLTRVATTAGTRTLRWGSSMSVDYIRPPTPPPPVVVDDGQFTYRTERTANTWTTVFTALDGAQRGWWQIEESTGRVKLGYRPR